MAKKKEDHPETVNFSSTALSIVRHESGWAVAVVPLDPVSGITGEIELVPVGDSREEAQERFKILSVQKNIIQ